MRRIKNSDDLRQRVKDFNANLFITTRQQNFIHPLVKLKSLRLSKNKAARFGHSARVINTYIKKIEDEYLRILNADGADMKRLISEFDSLIHSESLGVLHEAIVLAMRYDDLREIEFPRFLAKMDIKTCVYCHSQSTLVVNRDKRKWRALLQLDHKHAKSKFPFLCTTFFNLYPICANCNLSKSDKPTSFELYVAHDELDLFRFGIEKKSIIKYWKSGQADQLQIKMDVLQGNSKSLEAYNKMFNITEIYNQHKDIAEELIHKADVYNKSYKHTLVDSFTKLFPDQSMINRLLIGNYDKSSDMLKRPMAKFVQEIARDIKLIPMEEKNERTL